MSVRKVAFAGFVCVLFGFVRAVRLVQRSDPPECVLPESLKREIHEYQSAVDEIIGNATDNKCYGSKYYRALEEFVDAYGGRLAGTKNLENAIDHLVEEAKNKGFKVRTETIKVPRWIRGNESAYLITPRKKKLEIIGLGTSGSTPPDGIIADVVVVSNFKQLDDLGKKVAGRIVLFNAEFTTYGKTAKYRNSGPSKASKLGAVAALVRSITPFSIYSPHTGDTDFEPNVKTIPAAAITLEDADYMARAYAKGQKVQVWLKMDDRVRGEAESRNLIVEMPGSTLPDEYVLGSGHIDSWDNGDGALDDGVGAFLALHTLYLLKTMDIPQPKRTIRAILWSGEELGLLGAEQYRDKHKNEIDKWTAVFESDAGSFDPIGLSVESNHDAWCVVKEVASMFGKANATQAVRTTGVGSDITVFRESGVPLVEPRYGPNNYFWYHHTAADSMRTLNSTIMDKNLAIHAAALYVLANLSKKLPRNRESIWAKGY